MLQLITAICDALNGLLDPSSPLKQSLTSARAAEASKPTDNHLEAIRGAVAAAYDACGPPEITSVDSLPVLTAESPDEAFVERQRVLGRRKRVIDTLRGAVDVVGREVVVDSVTRGDYTLMGENEVIDLQDRLDVILALYEVIHGRHPDIADFEPGSLLIPILEELSEILPGDAWRELWTWVEVRKSRFTKNMPDSRGKSLPLLRTINNLLRSLSRSSEDLILRGRIHMFASMVFKLSDRSSTNMRGQYAELQTTWEEEEQAEASTKKDEQGDGDVDMDEKKDEKEAPEDGVKDDGLYAKFWSLQVYFANPPYVSGKLPGPKGLPNPSLQDFKAKTEAVLPRLFAETEKSKRNAEVERVGHKRKREAEEEEEGFFHPRLLTDKRLFEYQLADVSFRRQILAQYYIFFQFLLNFVDKSAPNQKNHMMPADFRIDDLTNRWIKARIGEISQDLAGEPAGGQRFKDVLFGIILKERHHAAWKNKNCPEDFYEPFAKRNEAGQPIDETGKPIVFYLQNAADQWAQQTRFKRKRMMPMGGVHLARFWREGEAARAKPRSAPLSWLDVTRQVQAIKDDEAEDEAMGSLTPEMKERNKRALQMLNWRAARQAASEKLGQFPSWPLPHDVTVLKEIVEKKEEELARKKDGADGTDGADGAEGDADGDAEGEGEEAEEGGKEVEIQPDAEADVEGDMGVDAEMGVEAVVELDGQVEQAEGGEQEKVQDGVEGSGEGGVEVEGMEQVEGKATDAEETGAEPSAAESGVAEGAAKGNTEVQESAGFGGETAEVEETGEAVKEQPEEVGEREESEPVASNERPNRPPTPELPPPDEDVVMS